MVVARFYDLNWNSAFFIGLITALSSTAVVLKLLQERSELTSNYGRTVLGILIFQDIILVPLLLITPLIGGEIVNFPKQIAILILKTILIIGLVYISNRWLMPRLLHLIAMTRNQELFFMSILLICLAVALLTSELGMSLAFGAFLAGLMISESDYSHNIFGNIVPFKDIFTSFFFVSIGMLLDLNFVFENINLVLFTVLLVIAFKMMIGSFTAFILGHTLKGTILVGIAISQVGEFSFILAKLGRDYSIISAFYYQLFLAVAILTMAMSPLLIQIAGKTADLLLKLPIPDYIKNGLFPLKQIDIPDLKNHLVLIGRDSRVLNLSVMARYMSVPYISIIFDPALVKEKQQKGETVIYGDAVNEPILKKAHVDSAEIVVISIGDLMPAMSVTRKVREINSHAYIIVRTKYVTDIEELYALGADQVIPEEFETAINMFERILKKYLIPRRDINEAIAKIREDHYGIFRQADTFAGHRISDDIPNIEVTALKVSEDSSLINKSIKELQFRRRFSVTLVAIKRKDKIIDNPESEEVFKKGDIAYVLGKPEQIARAIELFIKNE
jgi:CPA2 family monovalent cation:H+ antiporter-2